MSMHIHSIRARSLTALFALFAALPACDPGVAADERDGGLIDAPSDGEAGVCPLDTRVGVVRIDVREDYPSISGDFADGVVPALIWFDVAGGAEGDCHLEKHTVPVCTETCGATETCDYDNNCIPYPMNHSVGTLEFAGLSKPVSIEPKGDDGYSAYDYVDLEYPFVAPGEKIVVRASGAPGGFGGFTLHSRGIEIMDLLDEELLLKKNEAIAIHWTAGTTGATIGLEINIDQHGASPLRLMCETEDTGSITIPSRLVDELIAAGVTGFPSLQIERRHGEKTDFDGVENGCVEFEASSAVRQVIRIEGHIPCQFDAQCPDGMTCDETIETCIDE